jgi:hypothetical protein
VLIGPLRDDLPEEARAEWIAIRPNTDTALMLALCWVLLEEGLYDRAFVARYTAGFDRFAAYLRSVPCTPDWAAAITGVPAATITALARSLPGKRSLIAIAHGLQRAEFGERLLEIHAGPANADTHEDGRLRLHCNAFAWIRVHRWTRRGAGGHCTRFGARTPRPSLPPRASRDTASVGTDRSSPPSPSRRRNCA